MKPIESWAQFLTTFDGLTFTAQLLTFLVTLAGLVLVYRQVRAALHQVQGTFDQVQASRQQNVVAALGQLVQLMTQLNELFIVHSDLRPHFYGGRELAASHERYPAAEAMSEIFLDVFDHILTHISTFPEIWDKHQIFWEAWVVKTFTQSPVLRAYYDQRKDWYTDEMRDCHRQAVEQLAGRTADATP